MSSYTLRHATKEDIPIILQLIQELADYEKASDDVKATPQTLEESLAFAPTGTTGLVPAEDLAVSATRPARTILLFTPEGEPAGMALYFSNYSTWRSRAGIYLEDLFVREKFRGKRYGQALISALAKEVIKMDGKRLEWSVLKWNKPSIGFYERIGANAMTEWMTMRVDGDNLLKLAERVK